MLLISDTEDVRSGKFLEAQSVIRNLELTLRDNHQKFPTIILNVTFQRALKALKNYFTEDKKEIIPLLESLSLFFQSVEFSTDYKTSREELKHKINTKVYDEYNSMLFSFIESFTFKKNVFTLLLNNFEEKDNKIIQAVGKSIIVSFKKNASDFSILPTQKVASRPSSHDDDDLMFAFEEDEEDENAYLTGGSSPSMPSNGTEEIAPHSPHKKNALPISSAATSLPIEIIKPQNKDQATSFVPGGSSVINSIAMTANNPLVKRDEVGVAGNSSDIESSD